MADALVSVVLEQLTSIIQREVEKEVKLLVGVREEIGKLSSVLTMLQAVLDDAEEKQVKEKAVKLWLEKLKDVVYDADDVLDEWNTRTIISQIHGVDDDVVNGGIRKKVLSYLFSPCFCFKDVVVRRDIGLKIKEVRERLDAIAEEKNHYHLIARRSPDRPRQLTSSLIDVPKVYGRDHDKAVIMGMLFSDSSNQVMSIHVITIVGTGGFGKTTLAKLVLNEEKVTTAFEKTMWVCVSEPFDRTRLAKEIIEQSGEKIPDVVGWDALHKCLCKSLRGKKFLLVLDDVWTEDANDWDPLKHALDGGASGSKILITTRNEKVAHMMGSTQNHKLGELSKDDSWLLFRLIAFQGREEDLKKMEDIGRRIAEKCNGVPLSVKSLASLMCLKKTKKEWNDVLTSEIWSMKIVEKDILPSLFLSYYPLPSNLKQCFVYCAIFPKDTKIEKDWLVKLWMAQGFLGSERSKDLEKIGEEYYDDLAMRSFFQDFNRDSDGNITSCKMHDLVHDFAQFLSKSECCILETNDAKFDESKVRHLAAIQGLENSSVYLAKKLRTFLTPVRRYCTAPIELYRQLTSLRTLDLSGWKDIVELPDEVEGLLHLRYLNLSNTELSELPETLCNLYNLQSLLLNWCRKLQKLPDGISKLSNLRHLEIKRTDALDYLPRGIGRLGFLRTLSRFIVGGGGSKGCKMGELKYLNFLRGDLEIKGLERVGDMNEAAEAELEKKKDLHGLTLNFGRRNESDAEKMEGVLKNLQPHENLEELHIWEYPGPHFPDWMARLSNLVNLTIDSCKNLRVLPDLSKLKSLETLKLDELDKLEECEEIRVPSNNQGEGDIQLPRLRQVWILDCPKLKVVPHYIMFPQALKALWIENCPELGGVQPRLPPLLEELKLFGDVGVFSKSLPLVGECSHNSISYPNLKSVLIYESPHSSLPKGFNRLTSIQSLDLWFCKTLDFELEELKHLTMLQYLVIDNCPVLKERFGEGKDWRSTLSHVPKIKIDRKVITGN